MVTYSSESDIRLTNLCEESGSEYFFLDDTSCNLGSLNLVKFYDGDKVNTVAFTHCCRIATIAKDIWIDKAYYPTEKITNETRKYHTIGLGYSNLGALLLRMGLAYDSDEARNVTSGITALMTFSAYAQSQELAKKLVPFPEWGNNKKSMANVINLHKKDLHDLEEKYPDDLIIEAASSVANKVIAEDPFRNAQISVCAPTGTISYMMDCDTTGPEPMFALTTYKNLVGGGTLKLTIPSVKYALQKLGYNDSVIASFEKTESLDLLKPEDKAIFATAVSTENTISWEAHLKMMAAIQPFISGAISKTCNLPNSATVEDIKNAYMMAWKLGLKSVAIYRDGCKTTQPLNVKKVVAGEKPKLLTNGRPKPVRRKLDDDSQALRHKFDIAGHEGYFHIGLYGDGNPGELFITMSKQGSTISGLMDILGTFMSIGLQYGIPVSVFIDKMKNTKFEPSGITHNSLIRFTSSPIDYIAKWLELEFVEPDESEDSTEMTDNDKTEKKEQLKIERSCDGPPCAQCGGLTHKAGTCYVCSTCGTTTGCG